MTDVSAAARALVGRSWEGTTPEERRARTAPGLAVISVRLRALVDPHGVMPEHELAEGIRAVRAQRLATNRARRNRTDSPTDGA